MQLDTANTFPFLLTSTYTLRISTARRERLCPHLQVPTASLQSSGLKDELQASLQGLSEMGIFGSNQIWSIHRNETDGRCQIGPSALGLEVAGICQTNIGQESLFFFFFSFLHSDLKVAPDVLLLSHFHWTCITPVTFRHGLLQGQVFNLQLGAQVAGQPYSDWPVHTYSLLYHQARPQGCGPPWKSWGARTFPSMAESSRDLLPCHITAAGRKNQGGGVSQTFCVIRNECHRSHFRGRWPARCCKQLSPGGAGPAAGGTVVRVPSAPCRAVSPVLEPAWHVAVSSLIGRVVFFSWGDVPEDELY
uniref:uncharacterized protein LOC132692380 isoform X2 n=1 Tax=Panthera onca TaxID=9690 RepID=UPI002955BC49|nr:uncharacterized protein LOC132692380 isoform X2 [Panthera onca]